LHYASGLQPRLCHRTAGLRACTPQRRVGFAAAYHAARTLLRVLQALSAADSMAPQRARGGDGGYIGM
jgi:hypothetical protein